MGGNLAKSPLVAIMYGSLLYFSGVFIPFSDMYSHIMTFYMTEIPLSGYLILLGYALLISVVAALVLSSTSKTGIASLGMMIAAFLGIQWVAPLLKQLILGEATGVMTFQDTLMRMLQGGLTTILILLLSYLLASKGEKAAQKWKLRPLQLVIFLLILPVLYTVFFFLSAYFLGGRQESIQLFYQMAERDSTQFLVQILLQALLRGVALELFSLLLMMLLPDQKWIFLITNTMLYLSGALLYLLPNPAMPWEAAMPHFIIHAASLAVYGGLGAFLLHTCYLLVEQPAPALKAVPGKR